MRENSVIGTDWPPSNRPSISSAWGAARLSPAWPSCRSRAVEKIGSQELLGRFPFLGMAVSLVRVGRVVGRSRFRGMVGFLVRLARNPVTGVEPSPQVDQFAALRAERKEPRQLRRVFLEHAYVPLAGRTRELQVPTRPARRGLVSFCHPTISLSLRAIHQPPTGKGRTRNIR